MSCLKKRKECLKKILKDQRSNFLFFLFFFFLINRISKYPLCLVPSLSLRGEILYLIEV